MQGFFLAPILIFLAVPLVGIFIEVVQPGAKILAIKTSTQQIIVEDQNSTNQDLKLDEVLELRTSSILKK